MENQDTIVSSGNVNPTIRSVSANQGVEWLVGGFRLFAKAPGPWLLAALALIVGSAILSRIWFGSALSTAFGIAFTGVMMRACMSLENGQEFAAHIKETASSTQLWILGAIGAGLTLGMMIVLAVIGVGAFGFGMMGVHGAGGMLGFGMLAMLFMLVMIVVLSAALWLAPALVVLGGVNPVDAVRLSLTAALRNVGAFLLFTLLSLLGFFIAVLPMGLGLLVMFPVMMCAYYLAYKDIFASSTDAVGYTAP